jgi:enterobactin synthetase component D
MSEDAARPVRPKVLTSGDEASASRLTGWREADKVTLVFSAKESIYKCLRPFCGEYFGFHDAELSDVGAVPEGEAGIFAFTLLRGLRGGFSAGWSGQGRYRVSGRWILTVVELPSVVGAGRKTL